MPVDLTHSEFQAAIPILKKIEVAGFEAYFVGGSVRDALLNLPIHDVDIATSAYPQEVKQIFNRTVDTGIQHGTVMVLDHGTGYEVTTFRTESTYQDFRRPDKVTFVRSLKEDQLRRDFTINALAARYDGTIIDNYGGLADLDAKTLRAVGNAQDRFHEDALRMMRAVRFESQLGFTLEAETERALAANASLLAHIAVERIAAEFNRLLLGINRQAGLSSFIKANLTEYCPLFAGQQAAVEEFAAFDGRQFAAVEPAWVLLCHLMHIDAGKMLRAWKQPNTAISTVQAAADLLPKLLQATATDFDLYTAGAATTTAITAVSYLDATIDVEQLVTRYAALPIHSSKELAVNGGQLIGVGFKPGPALGTVLRTLERDVVTGKLQNTPEALFAAAQAQLMGE